MQHSILILKLYLRSASRIFTNKFTFRFGAKRFRALPITDWFSANCLAFWFRNLTMSYTMRGITNIYTFWTIHHFTSFVRTHWFTIRSVKYLNFSILPFAFYITNCCFWFQTTWMTFWRFTHWCTNCITSWIITFPWAFRMAFLCKNAMNHKCKKKCLW